MPEYDMPEPVYEENRYHMLFASEDRFVIFNGDGSILKIYQRERDETN